MASVASQLIEEVTAHAQSDSLEDAREICADGTYFPINLSKWPHTKYCSIKFKAELSISLRPIIGQLISLETEKYLNNQHFSPSLD